MSIEQQPADAAGATTNLSNSGEEVLVKAQNLYKSFGNKLVVDNVNLTVSRGEVLGFLGPNGAGKSTTMRILTGFLEPDSGSITIAGKALLADPIAAKKHIGYLPEGSPLYSDMSILQFLRFVASARGIDKATINSRLEWVISALGLEQVVKQSLDTLSKGFRRRVGLAQSLIHDPDVLILDEPTDGLDPIQKHEVRNLIRTLASTKAIIISTHVLEEVEPLCSRVLIIGSGRTLCDAIPSELISQASGHNNVELTLLGPLDPKEVMQRIKSIQQIATVNHTATSNNAYSFVLTPVKGALLSNAVSTLCHTYNWKIHKLSVREGQIDEVFRELVVAGASTTHNLTTSS